jgi:hypothetical protein
VTAPIPSVDEALNAIADGDSTTLAWYLQATPLPSQRVILALAQALSAQGDTPHRLKFQRRRIDKPATDATADVAIFMQVETQFLRRLAEGLPERGLRKTIIGEIAQENSTKDRAVLAAYERVKRKNAAR